ncbi:VanZ family protein [Cetobacterium somerae]|uniref:VanZ family protein n=1 Tax=Cetobacterium sp. NK01 TaxID=2993530 RepID=UPI0021167609|nr:VanZ family protein [Cetobacterium sp. NK01]MCQ8212611.1 VanZ family protein [Cetobacterium sp. NK01]
MLSSFALAVIIYLLFRSRKLFYYQIVEMMNLDPHVRSIRKIVWVYRKYIPNWVIYSLPDGLWLFSMGVSILHNRVFYKKAQNIFNIIFLIMVGIEIFQGIFGGHGTFIGTFDGADVICYTIGYIIASLLSYLNWKKNHKDQEVENEVEVLKNERKKILIIVIVFTILGFFPALVT